jgi:hypothetical protein
MALLAVGCGRTELPFKDDSQNSDLYVKNIRSMIEVNCEAARRGNPAIHLAPLIQELDRNDRPVGPHKKVFADLRQVCHEAVDRIRSAEDQRPDIKSQLDGMIELAGQLPKREAPVNKPPVEAGS